MMTSSSILSSADGKTSLTILQHFQNFAVESSNSPAMIMQLETKRTTYALVICHIFLLICQIYTPIF